MSQSEKAALYKELQEAGVQFDKHYREYNTAELKAAVIKLRERIPAPPPELEDELTEEEAARFFGREPEPQPEPEPPATTAQHRMPQPVQEAPPISEQDPDEMPGQRLNQSVELTPIRTDDQGRVWFQEEVRKPAFAKPRGRRVLKYMDGGVEERTVVTGKTDRGGDMIETFEVAGTANRRPAEVKITLPSYQVGIYKDRRFPFKIHVYNGNQGFDLFEVQNYYGGAELVPQEIKRLYVENVLCYDIRTTVRAIQTEFRQLQLANKLPAQQAGKA